MEVEGRGGGESSGPERPMLTFKLEYKDGSGRVALGDPIELSLPEGSVASDVLRAFALRAPVFECKELRLTQVRESRIVKVFNPNDVFNEQEAGVLRVEAVPADQAQFPPQVLLRTSTCHKLVPLCHFKLPGRPRFAPFGTPFLVVVRKGEVAKDLMARIRREKMVVPPEELEESNKWKLAVVEQNLLKVFLLLDEMDDVFGVLEVSSLSLL